MLSKNGHHQPACDFAVEIVSILYDEAGISQKTAFAAHLDECRTCSQELADFGLVRSSILEWRDEEVSAIKMPVLELPVFESQVTDEKSATQVESTSSWLDSWRRMFPFSPKLAFGTAAFAILAICGFSALFILKSSSGEGEVAANTNQNNKIEIPALPKERKTEHIALPAPKEEIADTRIESSDDNPVQAAESKPARQQFKQQKSVNPPQKSKTGVLRNEETMADGKIEKRKNRKTNENELDEPKLYDPDEDEEDSLRLADLFEEIGTE